MKYILTIITIILIILTSYIYRDKHTTTQLNKTNHHTTLKKHIVLKNKKNQPMSQVKSVQTVNHKEKYEMEKK